MEDSFQPLCIFLIFYLPFTLMGKLEGRLFVGYDTQALMDGQTPF